MTKGHPIITASIKYKLTKNIYLHLKKKYRNGGVNFNIVFFFLRWGETLLGTSATFWPIGPELNDG
jgi:hypothetical protein